MNLVAALHRARCWLWLVPTIGPTLAALCSPTAIPFLPRLLRLPPQVVKSKEEHRHLCFRQRHFITPGFHFHVITLVQCSFKHFSKLKLETLRAKFCSFTILCNFAENHFLRISKCTGKS